jgi:hypothetical protein
VKTHVRIAQLGVATLVGTLSVGCTSSGEKTATVERVPAAMTAPSAAASAVAAAPRAAPSATGYSLAAVKTIADNCSSARAILATAPASVGNTYPWNISRQALLANQQLKVVQGAPTAPGQISLATHTYGASALALVASCADGGTCNQLAAMYKAIVRSSHPQVICGKVPNVSSTPVNSFSWAGSPEGNLPARGDVVAACARLSACMIATDRSTPGDPFLECQRAPSKFKTACATRHPCADVIACADQ